MVLIPSLGLKNNIGQRNKKGKLCHYLCQYEEYFKDYQGVLKVAL